MSIFTCTYPKCDDVEWLIGKLLSHMRPIHIIVDKQEVYLATLRRLEQAPEKANVNAETFVPYLTIRENARLYGPQYKLTAELNGMRIATGSINSISTSLIYEDEYMPILLDHMLEFANDIPSATIELENDLGEKRKSSEDS